MLIKSQHTNSDEYSFGKDCYYLQLARDVAKASKCIRAQYGSVIVSSSGIVISTGYNGKPRGSINDHVCYRTGLEDNASKPNCCLHAEDNAIMFAGTERCSSATLYVNGISCTDCTLKIMQARLSRVVMLYDTKSSHHGNFDEKFYNEYGMKFKYTIYEI